MYVFTQYTNLNIKLKVYLFQKRKEIRKRADFKSEEDGSAQIYQNKNVAKV